MKFSWNHDTGNKERENVDSRVGKGRKRNRDLCLGDSRGLRKGDHLHETQRNQRVPPVHVHGAELKVHSLASPPGGHTGALQVVP